MIDLQRRTSVTVEMDAIAALRLGLCQKGKHTFNQSNEMYAQSVHHRLSHTCRK
jgi:hypothetical protein